MKPAEFDYVRATSLDDAVAALDSDEDAKLLAGGQSLVPMLNMRLVRPSVVVDLRRVEGLDGITRTDTTLRIGAMVTQRDAETSPTVGTACPLLVEALCLVAHPQIRNRGTIGGSLAHADPAAELPAVVLLLDGVLRVHGRGGERSIPAAEFFRSYLTTALEPGEILTAVELPVATPRSGSACLEVTRRPGDFPLCGAACHVELGDDGTLTDARLALFGVADRPVRATAAEERLRGARPDERLVAVAAETAVGDLTPRGDLHASPAYRHHLTQVVARRCMAAAVGRARADAER